MNGASLFAGIDGDGIFYRQLWLPPGMAHGFLVTSERADFLYKTTAYYAPEAERCIVWNDPAIANAWPDLGRAPQLSARDAAAPLLADAAPMASWFSASSSASAAP